MGAAPEAATAASVAFRKAALAAYNAGALDDAARALSRVWALWEAHPAVRDSAFGPTVMQTLVLVSAKAGKPLPIAEVERMVAPHVREPLDVTSACFLEVLAEAITDQDQRVSDAVLVRERAWPVLRAVLAGPPLEAFDGAALVSALRCAQLLAFMRGAADKAAGVAILAACELPEARWARITC